MNPIRRTHPALLLAALCFVLGPAAVRAHEGKAHTHPTETPVAGRPSTAAEGMTTKVKSVTMRGEIVDPQCWIQHDGRGKAHTGCALACAKAGQTLAFLDDRTGTLYQLLAENHS